MPYHVEIRDFPRNVNRFNMSGSEVGVVLLAWAQERVFELADQRWNPQTAELTVLEGPEIPVSGLSMGRGWPTAVREGQDVTDRVLSEAREAVVDGSAARLAVEQEEAAAAIAAEEAAAAEAAPSGETDAGWETAAAAPVAEAYAEPAPPQGAGIAPAGDELALGVELAALLGPDAPRLLAAWREVAGRASGLSPSESLALAERRLRDEQL
jgi:hypothetical protein